MYGSLSLALELPVRPTFKSDLGQLLPCSSPAVKFPHSFVTQLDFIGHTPRSILGSRGIQLEFVKLANNEVGFLWSAVLKVLTSIWSHVSTTLYHLEHFHYPQIFNPSGLAFSRMSYE